jgi:hypothetical protein
MYLFKKTLKSPLTKIVSPTSQHSRCRNMFVLLLVALSMSLPLRSTAATVTNWIAFNEHAPSTLTAPRVTVYNMRGWVLAGDPGVINPLTGNLTNFASAAYPAGYGLPVAYHGSFLLRAPDLFPNAAMGYPFAGTPAYNLFSPGGSTIADLGNAGDAIGVGNFVSGVGQDTVVLTFSNLNAGMRYKLRGTAVRNGTGVGTHSGRWTISSIAGADSFTDAATPFVLTSANLPGVPGLALTNGQQVFQSGVNTNGDLVGWDEINPGADGTFSIITKGYGGPVKDFFSNMGPNAGPGATFTNAYGSLGYALSAVMLLEYGSDALSIITQPAPSTTVNEPQPFTLNAAVEGAAPYFQWYKDGVLIPGATLRYYSVTTSAPSDAGNYTLVVTNSTTSVTSTVAQVTVTADTTAPTLVRAVGNPTLTNVVVSFSELIAIASGSNLANYTITNSAGLSLTIFSATVNGTNVVLHTAPQTPGGRYMIVVNNLTDRAATPNTIAANSTISFSAWVFSKGFTYMETYGTGGGNTVNLLTNHATYPNNPAERYFILQPNSREAYPNDSHDNYGGRISGWFVPAASGNVQFSIINDDDALLRVSPTAYASDVQDVGGQACCSGTYRATGSPLSLTAGNRYYFEILWKEGGGADYAAISIDGVNPVTNLLVGVYGNPDAVTLAITAQPTNQQSVVNQTATFSVSATVTPLDGIARTLGYQWLSNGVEIAGAIGSNYTTALLSPENNGDAYSVQVLTAGSILLSSNALVSVSSDTNPPVLLSVRGDESFQRIHLSWSELMASGPAVEPSNFIIYDGNSNQLYASSVTYLGSNFIINLEFPLVENSSYWLEIDNQTDLVGNQTAAVGVPLFDTEHGVVATVRSFVIGRGFARMDTYLGIGTTAVSALESDPRYPNSPSERYLVTHIDSRDAYPDNSHENYGGRIYGYFIPDVTRTYTFYLRSDDASSLRISTDANPANKVEVTSEPACCNPYSLHQANVAMTAGSLYYFEALWKEGGGGDFVQVSIDGTNVVPGTYLAIALDPTIGDTNNAGIAQQPANQIVPENQQAAFSVVVTNVGPLGISYQWQIDTGGGSFSDIPGANAATYVTPFTVAADNGKIYRVKVYVPGKTLTSATATLEVIPDLAKPYVISARSVRTSTSVLVKFSERITQATAELPANYSLTDSSGTPVTLGAPVLSPDQLTVSFAVAALPFGSNYTLHVENLADVAGNIIVATNVPFQTWTIGLGSLFFDVYSGLDSGNSLSGFTNAPIYPDSPSVSTHIAGANSRLFYPDDSHEAYGGRISGYFVPQITGNYTFYISADDDAELSLSTDSSPSNRVVIVTSPSCCEPFSAHASASIPLVAGQRYYIQLLYKEGGGGDYGQIAAKLTSDPQNPNTLLPISGALLASLADPVGASITITQQPVNTLFLSNTAPANNLLLENFDTTNGGFTVVTPLAYTGPWVYNAGNGTWQENGQGPDNGQANISSLNSPTLSVTVTGNVVLTFSHRYSFEFDGTPWDGGQVRISVNGGAFTPVPASAFRQNGYTGSAVSLGQPSFISASPGYPGARITTIADLGKFNPGDVVRVQFYVANDSNTAGAVPNWEIDTVQVSQGNYPLFATFSVSVTATNSESGSNPPLAYQWFRDTGSGFIAIPGANSATYQFLPQTADNGASFRAAVYIPGANATSSAAVLTAGQPRLSIVKLPNGTAVLSWSGPYCLEETTAFTLPTTTWVDSSVANGVPFTPGPNTKFYRLKSCP